MSNPPSDQKSCFVVGEVWKSIQHVTNEEQQLLKELWDTFSSREFFKLMEVMDPEAVAQEVIADEVLEASEERWRDVLGRNTT